MEIIANELKLPQPKDKVLLRPHQVINYQKDLAECDVDLKNPRIQDKRSLVQRKRKLQQQYDDQAPRPITDPLVRDKVARRIKTLEDQIRVGMPTEEEMRKATNNTVEQHRRWERTNKPRINEWRNLSRQLHTDNADPDTWDRSLGDTERLRPRGVQGRYVADALIPGAMSYSDLPQENWDQVFDHQPNSALVQAKKVHAEQAKPKTRKPLSAEQKAAKAAILKKAREVAAAKRQAAASTPTAQVVPAQE